MVRIRAPASSPPTIGVLLVLFIWNRLVASRVIPDIGKSDGVALKFVKPGHDERNNVRARLAKERSPDERSATSGTATSGPGYRLAHPGYDFRVT
jgi:hypothetical protein